MTNYNFTRGAPCVCIATYHLHKLYVSEGYLGFNGPLTVETPTSDTLVTKAFLEASRELGYPIIDGMGPQQIG